MKEFKLLYLPGQLSKEMGRVEGDRVEASARRDL